MTDFLRRFSPFVAAAVVLMAPLAASCYPTFQAFAEKHSGRTVNCLLCHINDNGPAGDGPGQIGSLNAAELARLNEARTAMLPGTNVNSPIMNRFGNHIIKSLGMTKVMQAMADPAQLAVALGDKSDLDGDGIPDSREFLDGTDPLNKFHGDPWLLFTINLARYRVQLILAALSVGLLCYGLNRVYQGYLLSGQRETSGSGPPEGPVST